MSIGAILVGLALLIITIPIVAGPVVNKRKERKFLADEPEELNAQEHYQQALLALRELDFDHQLDVVTDEDYAALRAQLLTDAAQAREATGGEREVDLEERIEAAVRALRHPAPVELTESSLACYQCGAEMDAGDQFCAACGSRATAVCSHCGRQADPGDKFCVGCGMNLAVEVVA